MPRHLPEVPLSEVKPRSTAPLLTAELKTLTPMFGGSSNTREVNSHDPVRGASVRGHLRFWWRATVGRFSASTEEMFERESQIWGGTDSARNPVCSAVGVQIERVFSPPPISSTQWLSSFQKHSPLPYALFPFQEQRRENIPAAQCLPQVHFKVHLTAPEAFRSELEQAVLAWVRYGGIGARSRRGCGSLQWLNAPDGLALPGSGLGLPRVTGLPTVCLYGPVHSDPIRAWEDVLQNYKSFRQLRHGEQKGNRPGRSRWPEPDSIRLLAGTHAYRHPPRFQEVMFPRADLGLPIVFHFKADHQRSSDPKDREPKDHTLESTSRNGSRFASPVITKVIPNPHGKGYLPMFALLDAPHVWEEGDLKAGQHTISSQQVELSPGQRQRIAPLNGQPVREALIHWYENAGYRRTL